MLVLLFGIGTLAFYQIMVLEDRLDQVTQAVDQMDGKVKRAQYEKAKFYAIAKDVLRLAPKDPNAQQVATDFKLQQLQTMQPALMDLNAPSTPANPTAPAQTNEASASASLQPSEGTNAASPNTLAPAAK